MELKPVVAVVVVAVSVSVSVSVPVYLVLELYFVSYTRCDLSSTLMSSPPFRFN